MIGIKILADLDNLMPRTKWWVYKTPTGEGEFLDFTKILHEADFPVQSFRRQPTETERDLDRRIMAETETYKVRRAMFILRQIGKMLHDLIPFAEPYMEIDDALRQRCIRAKHIIEHSIMEYFSYLVGRRFLTQGKIVFATVDTEAINITFKLEWETNPLSHQKEQLWISSLPCLPPITTTNTAST